VRLMFGKIERQTVPPQTAVPMRSARGTGGAVPHAPVQLTVHAKRVPARAVAGASR